MSILFHKKFTVNFSNIYWQLLKMDIIYIEFSSQYMTLLKEGVKVDNRKKKILQAIVEEYINTAEPVSSRKYSKKIWTRFK